MKVKTGGRSTLNRDACPTQGVSKTKTKTTEPTRTKYQISQETGARPEEQNKNNPPKEKEK